MRRVSALFACSAVLVSLLPAPARAASAPDAGRAWEPAPKSERLYGSKPPSEDPETQQHFVEGHDGTQLFVETWLPEPLNGNTPPKKVPTILIMTPYVVEGQEEYPAGSNPSFVEYFNAHGYAVAQHHVRGTGESGGCLEQTAENQIDDGARVVEYLGKEAPWSNGRVGMYGVSYDAETQISTAGFGDPSMIKYLKAIVPVASVGSQYDWNFMDGVPWTGQPLIGNAGYLATVSMFPGQRPAPQHYTQKLTCQAEVMMSSADQNGDYTDYWQAREYRPGAPRVKAATLFVHGLRDFNVQPITASGWFDALSKKTPHKGLLGVWNHALPSSHARVEPAWERADWYPMVTAWYDRYLKGIDTGVERWPDVQIQSNDGQWWVADEYPSRMGRNTGQLALSGNGVLGATPRGGDATFIEQPELGMNTPSKEVVFETPKMKDVLHVTGLPVLDAYVTSTQPDAHIGVKLEVIGSNGDPLRHEGSSGEFHATYGARSLQHVDRMKKGYFNQEAGKPFPVNEPTRIQIRFLPTDLVVHKGQSLRLTISGSVSYSKGDSLPSGNASQITIHHDCDFPSVLRFYMPDARAELLNVREKDEASATDPKRLVSKRATAGRRDGAGLASAPVCGRSPSVPSF